MSSRRARPGPALPRRAAGIPGAMLWSMVARSAVGTIAGIVLAVGCGFDVLGTGNGLPSAGRGDAPGSDPAHSMSSGVAEDASSDAHAGIDLEAAVDSGGSVRATCQEILTANPLAPTGFYAVDPGGAVDQAPIPVLCDMTTEGGGWTLVGRELAGSTGQLRFLGVDSNNPAALAAGIASGLIGKRFVGRYTQVWIAWGIASFIRFTRPNDFDLFANVADRKVDISAATTSDSQLSGWFSSGGGARLCVASRSNDLRPGDTSWAIKARDDNNDNCGCNDRNWGGRGAYYGGTVEGQQTSCDGWGGGWAGVKGNGDQKGGITPTYETRIWIR